MDVHEMVPTPVPSTGCCPPFDPAPWHEKELVWRDKLFVTDHVHSLFHIPIDMEKKMRHDLALIDAAGARAERPLTLSDDKSLWGSELFIDVKKAVPGAQMTRLSGRFLTKVYEGPFREAGRWMEDMREYVERRGYAVDKMYLGYPMCPKCAETYGENPVIVFAKVTVPL